MLPRKYSDLSWDSFENITSEIKKKKGQVHDFFNLGYFWCYFLVQIKGCTAL